MSNNIKKALFFLIAIIIVMVSCIKMSPYPPDVDTVLKEAGDNRVELEKVLKFYSAGDDTLKLQAAYFLIGNMEGHCYATYILHDSSGNEINFNVLDYPDFKTLLKASDSLEAQYGELDFKKDELIYDIDNITADFLIEQIDYAFSAWREKPWAKYLSFEDFCKYVLPYRGSNEPLERWRSIFREKYADIENKMTDPTDPIEAACLINDDIRSWFKFDERYYYHPVDQGISEMLENKMGRCEDMTNITIYALRANGLAVTSDYTPYWASSGNNHAWNAIAAPDGNVIPFMGAEANPGSYNLAHKFAKVYRKMYGQQKDNLIFQDKKQEEVPRWLAGKSYLDVTADYIDVCDVEITFDRDIPDSVDIAYICVFNSGKWKAIHWGKIEGNSAVFTDMGKDIAYLPSLYINEEVYSFGLPFILNNDCTIRELKSSDSETAMVKVASTTKRKLAKSTDQAAVSSLAKGKEYELFYWQDEWKSLGKAIAGSKPLAFDDVPAKGLYWLVVENSDEEERIFTYENDRQVWW